MGKKFRQAAALTIICGMALSAPAYAQSAGAELLQLGDSALNGELRTRYDASLAATTEQAVVSANDPRYIWASEAKVQCGIAIGFMKSSTRDETSIRKCGDAYARFTNTMQAPPPPVSTVPDEICNQKIAGIVFFEFDSSIPPAESAQTIEYVAANTAACGWKSFTVSGHTDRAGSDAYNNALSVRRAEAVAEMMKSRGIDPGVLTVTALGETVPRVPTPDGERNPQNRRVEITVN